MAQLFMQTMGWIDTTDLTGTYTFTEPNQARFSVEQKLREIYFVAWNLMNSERKKRKLIHADQTALAESRLAAAREKGSEREIGWYAGYLSKVENKEKYEFELVRLTLTM